MEAVGVMGAQSRSGQGIWAMGFCSVITTYTTDKRNLGDDGLEKRCRKAKREAEDMVIKREVGGEVFERDRPHYDDYEDYGSVPV